MLQRSVEKKRKLETMIRGNQSLRLRSSMLHKRSPWIGEASTKKQPTISRNLNNRIQRSHQRKQMFSTKNTTSNDGGGGVKFKNAAEKEAYLNHANETMKMYHDTKLQMLEGKLKPKSTESTESNGPTILIVVGMFLAAFTVQMLLGKKIARDEEFRKKWVPSWYDYTVERPKSQLSRQEIHDRVLQLQKEIRERAIRGDFNEEKLRKMRRSRDGLDPKSNLDDDEHAWSKIHPGLDDDEELAEED